MSASNSTFKISRMPSARCRRTPPAPKIWTARRNRVSRNLQRENHELKLYLATVVKLLVAKGVIRQEEVDTAV